MDSKAHRSALQSGVKWVDDKSVYGGRADEVALNLQEHEANRGSLDVVC